MTKESQTALTLIKDKPLAKRFEWRDASGAYHLINEMETRHLFYTLRMIWNHSMPEEARSFSYKPYRFSSFYTSSYIADAIRHIVPELFGRDDLEPAWKAELDRFSDYLRNRQPLVDAA